MEGIVGPPGAQVTEINKTGQHKVVIPCGDLEIFKWTREDERDELLAQFPFGRRFKVAIRRTGVGRAVLLAIDELGEIDEAAATPTPPREVEVPGLGTLTEERHGFTGTAGWNGQPIEVTVLEDDDAAVIAHGALVAQLVSEAAEWDPRLRRWAADELMPTARNWDETDELTEDDFIRRIKLTTISLDATDPDEFTAWFEDDEIFAGHDIEVRFTRTALISADMVG